MLRLSRLTDYGTVILAHLATTLGRWSTVTAIAQATHLPSATVGKILKHLARRGLVVSQRGAHGGYRLGRDPGSITALEILECLETRVAMTNCSLGTERCHHVQYCRVRTPWQTINEALRRTLATVTLADLALSMPPSSKLPVILASKEPDLPRSAVRTPDDSRIVT